jgi:hypothetical protein
VAHANLIIFVHCFNSHHNKTPPMLTLEPRVRLPMRYGSPVQTPLMTWRVMKLRSICRLFTCASKGIVSRTLCANTRV